MALLRDMLFSILFAGDEPFIRELVLNSAHRLGAQWDMAQVHAAGLLRLRCGWELLGCGRSRSRLKNCVLLMIVSAFDYSHSLKPLSLEPSRFSESERA